MRTLSEINRLIILAALLPALAIAQANGRFQSIEASKQVVPPDTLITLERTVCYGTCPIYKMTISSNGSVVFEGRRFVKKVGTAKSAISQEQLRVLLAAFEKIRYFELRDRYEQPEDGCEQWVTDNPSAITSLTLNGKSKSVRHYHGCSGIEVLTELGKLEQAIDDAVNSAQWIR
jgi:Domain of unknown function (DUF6438)